MVGSLPYGGRNHASATGANRKVRACFFMVSTLRQTKTGQDGGRAGQAAGIVRGVAPASYCRMDA